MTDRVELDANQRDVLGEIVDVLIPAAAGMPSARAAGVQVRWIDEALRLRPDLSDHLFSCLQYVANIDKTLTIRAALSEFARSHVNEFASVGVLISGAYYMDDRSRAALRYPGQESRRLVDDTAEYLEMLERVVDRGPVYRPTPR